MIHDTFFRDQWGQLRDKLQAKWDRLTDEDLDMIAGDGEVLAGALQEHYGGSLEELEKEVESWLGEQKAEPRRVQPRQAEARREGPRPAQGRSRRRASQESLRPGQSGPQRAEERHQRPRPQ